MFNVYIAGPMRGYPEFNFPAFKAAEARVRWSIDSGGEQIHVFNPATMDEEADGVDTKNMTGNEHISNMEVIIRRDMEAVLEVDAIYMMSGWEASLGARAEHALALWRGIKVLYEQG